MKSLPTILAEAKGNLIRIGTVSFPDVLTGLPLIPRDQVAQAFDKLAAKLVAEMEGLVPDEINIPEVQKHRLDSGAKKSARVRGNIRDRATNAAITEMKSRIAEWKGITKITS